MTNQILIKFAKKGINLSPEAFDVIKNSDKPLDLSSSIILKLKGGNYTKEDIVSVQIESINKILKELGMDIGDSSIKANDNSITDKEPMEDVKPAAETKSMATDNKPAESTQAMAADKPAAETKPMATEKPVTPKTAGEESYHAANPAYPTEHVVKIEDTKVSDEIKHKYKRNDDVRTANFDKFKIIKDTSNQSYTDGDIDNLIKYFQSRYNKLSNILSKRPELRTFQKVNDITENQTDLNLIVMITDIKKTKNGHFLLDCEDDTESILLLVSKDNEPLIREATKLMRDEVIGVIAERRPGSELAICQNIINPGVPRMPKKEMDFGAVFTSDIHIGSTTFLDKAYGRFIKWLNGDFGNEEQMEMANNVKYMIIGGDIVDGIGVYPNQDKELAIKDITAQYDEAARFLGDVRSDVKIIITPGNHDASRVAEPQPAVPEKYAKSLYELKNVEFVSNPATVSLDGLNVLIYHGRGIDDMVMGANDFSHERNDLVMKEFLDKRHLAPIYGERTPLASELEDHLVIDQVPDVLHTGHVHINTYTNYKGIHCINSGTFQTQTEFQKIYNIVPTPAEVPILDKGVYKQLKFI